MCQGLKCWVQTRNYTPGKEFAAKHACDYFKLCLSTAGNIAPE
jgi:hypothetical protein